MIGCGGLGSECGHGLVRKGVGRLTMFDYDLVELSNLARQCFFRQDVDPTKALCLAKNLARQATGNSVIAGHAMAFQTAVERRMDTLCTAVICAVDNNRTRVYAARHYLELGIPVIFTPVDRAAARGYVFVQESQPGTPCFLCLFPEAEQDTSVDGCAGASIGILKIVAGIVLYALDSLLVARPRSWNYKEVFLDKGVDGHRSIAPRPACPLCGQGNNSVAVTRSED